MKITIDRSVLEQALDALVRNYSDKLYDGHSATAASSFEDDIAAIKALAQPAPQPAPQPAAQKYPMTHHEAAAAIAINSALHRIRDNNPEGAIVVLEHAKKVLAAAPQPSQGEKQ